MVKDVRLSMRVKLANAIVRLRMDGKLKVTTLAFSFITPPREYLNDA